jgi:hypothetical protein
MVSSHSGKSDERFEPCGSQHAQTSKLRSDELD